MRISDWSSDVCSSDLGSIDYRVEPPSPGGHIFLFQETEHPEGGIPRTIAFRDVTVVPRGYEELIATKPDKAVTIKLEMRSGTIVDRSEEHTSELTSLMRTSYAVFCLKTKNIRKQ